MLLYVAVVVFITVFWKPVDDPFYKAHPMLCDFFIMLMIMLWPLVLMFAFMRLYKKRG